MTIRKRITCAISIILILVVLVTYLTTQNILTPRFAELEDQHLRGVLQRLTDTLEREQSFLDKVGYDWADWDDTYQFAADKNSAYIMKNLANNTFTSLQLSFMLYLDRAGNPIYEKVVDLRSGKEIDGSSMGKWIDANKRRWLEPGQDVSHSGVILSPNGPVLIAIHPILTSERTGPVRGSLMIGRFLNQEDLKKLIGVMHFPVIIKWRSADSNLFKNRPFSANRERPLFVKAINQNEIEGTVPIRDITGKSTLIAALRMPRQIFRHGQESVFYFLSVLAASFILLALLFFGFLDKLILKRLTALNHSVNEIAASNDFSFRIPAQGRDELTNFTFVFNRMMANLEQSHQELEASHQKMVDIIELLPDPTFVIDEGSRVVAWNRAIEELTGIRKEEMIGKGDYAYAIPFFGKARPLLIDLVSSDETEIKRYYESADRKGAILFSEHYINLAGQERSLFIWAKAAPLYNFIGEPAGAIESIRDISGRKQVEDELKFLSLYDPLTGLYNRAFFEKEVQRFEAGLSLPVGIIMCDVDGLKLVNDSLGHIIGDQLLRKAAAVIGSAFRDHDIIARIGGDEFAVLIPQSDGFILELASHRIQEAVLKYNEANSELPLSISVGWAYRKESELSLQDVIKEADNNMYREKLLRNESARSAIVQTLMKTLGARDFITEGHADRLKKMVGELARKLGLSDRKIHDISLLAQFHDIGKVGIPDNILFKPGPLDDEERSIMKRHTEIGFSIAQSAQELLHISEWILLHHERWDGDGYPCGRKGDGIPLECRILAIVDSYDAMTSDRPYRKAMSHQEAVAELHRCAGTQFDPQLVAEFIAIMEREIQ